MGHSTNGKDVLELIRMVVDNLDCNRRPYLVYDGHKAHSSNIVKAFINEHF